MAIALVANVSRAAGGATAAIDTTGADFLVAAVIAFSNPGTITDSKGNTWIRLADSLVGTNALTLYTTRAAPTVGASHTFTVGGSFPAIAVAAYSGVRRTVAANGVTSTSIQPGALNMDASPGMAIAALGWGTNEVVAIDSPFTITDQVNFGSGVNLGVALAYAITTAVSVNPTWSWTDNQAMTTCLALVNAEPTGGASSPASYVG